VRDHLRAFAHGPAPEAAHFVPTPHAGQAGHELMQDGGGPRRPVHFNHAGARLALPARCLRPPAQAQQLGRALIPARCPRARPRCRRALEGAPVAVCHGPVAAGGAVCAQHQGGARRRHRLPPVQPRGRAGGGAGAAAPHEARRVGGPAGRRGGGGGGEPGRLQAAARTQPAAALHAGALGAVGLAGGGQLRGPASAWRRAGSGRQRRCPPGRAVCYMRPVEAARPTWGPLKVELTNSSK
jgi:hypothetical protein